jgi:tetratricopeptide (TPR) repeat protein
MAAWREALDISRRLGASEVTVHLCAEMALNLFWSGRIPEAVEVAERGLSSLGDAVIPDRAVLVGMRGLALSYSGDFAAAEGLTTSAVSIAEGCGDARVLGYALDVRTIHHFIWQQCRECVALGMHAAETLRASGDVFLLANHLCIVEHALLWLGRTEEALVIGQEVGPLAQRIGHHGAIAVDGSVRLYGEIMAGHLDAVERSALRLLALSREHDLGFIADFHTLLGLAAFWRGDWERAVACCEEGVRTAIPGALAGAPWAFSFLIHAYIGDRQHVLTMFEGRPDLPTLGQPLNMGHLTMIRALVEGLVMIGRDEEASCLYPLLRARIDDGLVLNHWDMRLLNAVAGLAAAAGREWDTSEEHYQAALRQAEELPHRLDQPEVRRLYAMMLMERAATGDLDLARVLLTDAIARYRTIGMPRHVAAAKELLVRTGTARVHE